MSHNITLNNIRITDLTMFGQIAAEMSKGQVKLVNPSTTFRTYSGQPNNCDAKLALPGPHDVGLRLQKDGSYSLVFDPYAMDRIFQHPQGTNAIGALLQEYTLQEAEYAAAQNGMSATRVHGDKGVVTLELVPAA